MKVELTPAGKLVGLALLLGLLVFIGVHQGPDARRYMKIESM